MMACQLKFCTTRKMYVSVYKLYYHHLLRNLFAVKQYQVELTIKFEHTWTKLFDHFFICFV